MKVYCSNCKYYLYRDFYYYPSFQPNYIRAVCLKVSKIIKRFDGKEIFEYIGHASIVNKKCNCKFYKRLWYKFWIKE